jgi:UDP-N-acetylmuramyl pentapeptide phosphotransferase/UDP-N-acetylglucosamine-1-phosphate transferase
MINYFVETLTMFTQLISIALIVFSSFNPVFAQDIKYDLPGNKDLPKSSFVPKPTMGGVARDRVPVSLRLVLRHS